MAYFFFPDYVATKSVWMTCDTLVFLYAAYNCSNSYINLIRSFPCKRVHQKIPPLEGREKYIEWKQVHFKTSVHFIFPYPKHNHFYPKVLTHSRHGRGPGKGVRRYSLKLFHNIMAISLRGAKRGKGGMRERIYQIKHTNAGTGNPR